MENLSLTFNFYKKKLKLTNEKIAQMADVPVQTIERISSGRTKNPNLKTLKALAGVFECSLDDLMNLRDTTRPYYFDEETAKIAQTIQGNETLKTLFGTMLLLTNENQQAVTGLAERLKNIQKQNI
jgi:transcriptional regulator with XRE-family HTH domain